MNSKSIRELTEGAMMVALSTVLSLVVIFALPMGGEITLGCMVPILYFSMRHDVKSSLLVSGVSGVIQMLLGMKNVMYGGNFLACLAIVLLDYVVAYGVIGLAGSLGKAFFQNEKAKAITGSVFAIVLRYLCHITSGFLVWQGMTDMSDAEYVGAGWVNKAYWTYNLAYNSFVFVDGAIAIVLLLVLLSVVKNKRQ